MDFALVYTMWAFLRQISYSICPFVLRNTKQIYLDVSRHRHARGLQNMVFGYLVEIRHSNAEVQDCSSL